MNKWSGAIGALGLWLASGSVQALDAAAEINLLTGKGTASTEDGEVRPLVKGDKVYSGEVISSGPNSYVNLRFADGAFVLIRPNSRFQIESYEFKGTAPEPAKPTVTQPAAPAKPAVSTAPASSPAPSRAFFRLLKGGFRAVSGIIGKIDRNEYRVATPVATIGIRGTDFNAVVCDAACANDPVVRQELTEGVVAEGGLIAGVVDGAIAVDSNGRNCDKPDQKGAECVLNRSEYLLVASDGAQVRLEGAPRFLEVDPIPNPQTCAP